MNTIFRGLTIIGRGTDPDMVNEVTISLKKSILATIYRDPPEGGWSAAEAQHIAEMRATVEAYEAEHGEVR